MDDLIMQYQTELRQVKKKRENMKATAQQIRFDAEEELTIEQMEELAHIEAEDKIYSGIEGDLKYALEWMKTSKCPGSMRGIERRSVYEKTLLFDPLKMQKYFRSHTSVYPWDTEPKQQVLGPGDMERISQALAVLTEREKEVYLMSKGRNMSYEKIARFFGVKKTTIQNRIKSAEKKIERYLLTEGA